MSNLRLEILINNYNKAFCGNDCNAQRKAELELTKWVFVMALRGRLYCKSPNGEMKKIEVKQ